MKRAAPTVSSTREQGMVAETPKRNNQFGTRPRVTQIEARDEPAVQDLSESLVARRRRGPTGER